jgi:hypothetical protein
MRKFRKMRWLGIALLALAGCQTPDAELKPKYQPEEYTVPPDGETRFSSHINYPKETLFNDVIKKDAVTPKDPFQHSPRFGAGGPGGGGMGMGGY